MKLSAFVKEDGILLGMSSADERSLLNDALNSAPDAYFKGTTREAVLEALLRREAQGSTVLGREAVLIHGRVDKMATPFCLIVTTEQPVAVTPHGGEPVNVNLAFVLVTPSSRTTFMLKTMAALARLMADPNTAHAIVGMKSTAKVIAHLESTGIDIRSILIAADVMTHTEEIRSLPPEMALEEAVRHLASADHSTLPVVGKRGELLGEFGAEQLFALSIPRFLSLMADPGEFMMSEAFSKFFESDHRRPVRDAMAAGPASMLSDTPIMSIAQRMLSDRRDTIFVVDERGILLGIVSRVDIVRRIFAS